MNRHILDKVTGMTPARVNIFKNYMIITEKVDSLEIKTTEEGKFWSPSYKGITFDDVEDLKIAYAMNVAENYCTLESELQIH